MGRSKPEPKYRNGDFTLGNREGAAVADYRDENDKRRRARLGVPYSARDAAEAALNIFAEAQRAVRKQQASYTVGQLWEMWLDERAADKLSNEIYRANWVSLAPAFASRAPDLLTAQDFRAYASARFELRRSSWTVHTELVRLRACLKWAADTHLIAKRPKVWVPAPGKHRERVLSIGEARALVAGAMKGDPHVYLFVVIAFATGARHKAILDLEWNRIDWIQGTIQLDENLRPDPMSKSWRKGRATVPMNDTVRNALELAFEGHQTNHVIEHGGRRLKSVKTGFAAAVERAGLNGVTPHTIRHTVATMLREQGVSLDKIAKLLGHQDQRTTDLIYSHPSPAAFLAETVQLLDYETRRPIPSVPGYSACGAGFVWNISTGKRLKGAPSTNDYLRLKLPVDGKLVDRYVHRLICEAWHGPCPEGLQCRHLDGSRTNNAPINLEWATKEANEADKAAHGTLTIGERQGGSVLTKDIVMEARRRAAAGERVDLIAKDMGFKYGAILPAVAGRSWKHLPGAVKLIKGAQRSQRAAKEAGVKWKKRPSFRKKPIEHLIQEPNS